MEDDHHGLRLGSIGGTSLHVDFSFFILSVLFVMSSLQDGEPIQVALLWIPTLLISVIIHELGHAGMIALLGFGRSVIVLGNFGGVTMNARKARPWQNLLIALAGPIAGALFGVVLYLIAARAPIVRRDAMLSAWVPMMMY